MAVVVQQIVPGLIILLFVSKVLTVVGPESFGHECQDDEEDWMKGSQGPPWFSVKCQDGEAKACGFDVAKQKPDKSSKTLCPGEYSEPSGRKEVFACTRPTDAGATSKRTLIARHYSLDNDMGMLAKAIEEMSLEKLKAKPTPEYTIWKKKHDDWKSEHESWEREHETWQQKQDQWQAGYQKWKEDQDEEAKKFSVKVERILKKAPEYGVKKPAKLRPEPAEPKSPAAETGRNWMSLRQPLVTALTELGLKPSLSGKCAAVA